MPNSVRAADDIASTWPFWAPSEQAAVEAALDLADVGPGMVVVDLGCGDGQVLLAAAERGATVRGIESDPELAAEASDNLAAAGVDATIITGDLFDPAIDLAGDAWLTYLSPATLQRLVPRLSSLGAGPLVTIDFEVPGLIADARSGPAHRYALPARARRRRPIGWPSAGTLVTAVPDHLSLTCLEVVHPGGPVSARSTAGVRDDVAVFTGADRLDLAGPLAVDLRWEPRPDGTVLAGALQVSGLPSQPLFVFYTDADHGVWELTTDAVAAIRRARRRTDPPTTLAALLDDL